MEEDKRIKRQKIYKVVMLIILTAFVTYMITSLKLYKYYVKNEISPTTIVKESSNTPGYLKKIRSVIDNYYLWNDKIDEEKMREATIQGYVNGLGDKYTEYISKEEMEDFTEDIKGTIVGIGVYMVADEKYGIIVYYPIPESPAEKIGIKAGDIIKKVDGIEYGYEDFEKIVDVVRGKEGTKVKLVIERDGKEKEFEITRAKINVNPITIDMIEDNIGYLNLPSFDDGTANNFKSKVEELKEKGAKSLIIDLRNDGGGIVDESIQIADFFLNKGLMIMTTKDNKEKIEETKSKNNPIFDMPVVILSNENTASASEILIGALKDNDRATIIGDKTYGKGVIQTVISLADGSGLKITTAEYYTPKNEKIHEVGIEPNIKVELPDSVKSIYAVEEKDDTQLKKAIEELK